MIPSWAKLVHMSAAMDTAENPIPRDRQREESLTCTFVILGGPDAARTTADTAAFTTRN
jgi:hypothetical protein